ncbi:MAG TPA: DUF1214 domain-containing protein [Candidatus Binatia bacterium]|nr:DUF1214 domain-containing protein [Candidatus Binatia bacterium]
MDSSNLTESGRAFRALLDVLRDADATFLTGPRAGLDALAVAEGYRHLTHVLGYALDLYLENDPQRPHFTSLASPTRKILGDNVDSRYFFAAIDGARSYTIRGRRGNEVYLAFCIYGGRPDGEWSERVVANVSQRDIHFAPDGSFELVLSAERPAPATPNWIKLDADAVCVISREYFAEPLAAEYGHFTIEAAPPTQSPAPLTDAHLARRLQAAATFVRETIQFAPIPPLPMANALLPPMPWTPTVRGWGTPDNIYALGAFQLEPDQALVIDGRSPSCVYWGVQLWNRYMQSLDYRYHRVSINHAQATLAADGGWRVVIAHRDPGVPNWLDTAGHREGLFFCRWLQADAPPEHPTCSVVALDRVRD